MAVSDLKGPHITELMANQEPDPPFVPNSIKYVMVNQGSSCPNCGGDNVDWGRPEPEGETVFRPCSCNTCGVEWTERYNLTGVEEDPAGRNVLAFDIDGVKGYVSVGKDGVILHRMSDDNHVSYNVLSFLKNRVLIMARGGQIEQIAASAPSTLQVDVIDFPGHSSDWTEVHREWKVDQANHFEIENALQVAEKDADDAYPTGEDPDGTVDLGVPSEEPDIDALRLHARQRLEWLGMNEGQIEFLTTDAQLDDNSAQAYRWLIEQSMSELYQYGNEAGWGV